MLANQQPPLIQDIVTTDKRLRKKIGGLGNHFGGDGCGYENVSIQIIDQVDVGDYQALAKAEVYWQNQLRTYIQNGGNAHCRKKEKTYIVLPRLTYN